MLNLQDGVVSSAQLSSVGFASHDVRRLVRRRELVRLHRGVYLSHTGDPTWQQRAWGAVLSVEPAALAGRSALRAAMGPGWRGGSGLIEIVVDSRRTPVAPAGVLLRRTRAFDEVVQANTSPPRVRLEVAGIEVASGQAWVADQVETLAGLVRGRLTTADRLIGALADLPRVAGRADLGAILADLRDGTCSALERGYRVHVERPHGLPRPERQARDVTDAVAYRDLEYRLWGAVIELDGRAFHGNVTQHDRDLERDLVVALRAHVTVRLGWGQVFDRSCLTAERVGRLLMSRGWAGAPVPCGPDCVIARPSSCGVAVTW